MRAFHQEIMTSSVITECSTYFRTDSVAVKTEHSLVLFKRLEFGSSLTPIQLRKTFNGNIKNFEISCHNDVIRKEVCVTDRHKNILISALTARETFKWCDQTKLEVNLPVTCLSNCLIQRLSIANKTLWRRRKVAGKWLGSRRCFTRFI